MYIILRLVCVNCSRIAVQISFLWGPTYGVYEGVDRGIGLSLPSCPLTSPSRPLVSLLPSGAARTSRAQKCPLSFSLLFFLPSPSSHPLFSLLPTPLLPPPAPSSPSSLPLFSPLPSPLLPLPLTSSVILSKCYVVMLT